jgi:SAM-dependent methyltransferase
MTPDQYAPHTAARLLRKRVEIAGDIDPAQAVLRRPNADLAAIDRAIRVFDLELKINTVKRRRKTSGEPGLICLKADLTQLEMGTGTQDSVSCMHVVEHVGLGRYGDKLDASGDLKAIGELKRIVRPGGVLYFVAPTGNPGIYFNAHRVYSAKSILGYFEDQFDLEEFYFIPGPIELAPMLNPDLAVTLDYEYGCGCYQFRKR